MYNGINGDKVNEGEEETVSLANIPAPPTSPLPYSNSITCISHISSNTTITN